MDLSTAYIKMCEKAEEIQAVWVDAVDTGDIYFLRYKNGKLSHRRFSPLIHGYKPIDAERVGKRAIWLPRQDQLQEMIHSTDWISVLERFVLWAFGLETMRGEIYYGMGIPHNVFTMEQLWLAFVMTEKYQKSWNGDNWVKEVNHGKE